MVNIVIENILSTSKNRLIYEALWSLAITTKRKSNLLKINTETICIASICNDLMLELEREKLDRNTFYMNAQLVFGAIQLYQIQIDKLFAQSKSVMQSCNTTFFEINWLGLATQQSQIIRTQSTQRKGGKKQKGIERELNVAMSDFDLIEMAFTIPDEPIAKIATGKKRQVVDIDARDPTMASSVHITMLEAIAPSDQHYRSYIPDFGGEDEFGIITKNDYQNLFQETEDLNSQIEQIAATSGFIGIDKEPVPHISKRKRLWSDSAKPPRSFEASAPYDTMSESDINNNQMEAGEIQNISAFDETANGQENVLDSTYTVEMKHTPIPLKESQFIMESKDLCQLSENAKNISDVNKQLLHSKKLKTKRCIMIVDLRTKLSNRILQNNMKNYTKLIEERPRDSFESRIFQLKNDECILMKRPASRLKNSMHLIEIYSRNLKRISVKSKRLNSAAKLTSSANNLIGKQYWSNMEPEAFQASEIQQNHEIYQPSSKRSENQKSFKQFDELEYHPSEKWSRKQIMLKLKKCWTKKMSSITIETLCGHLNRFIAAGIFFELMVLSKEGAVELHHDDRFHISNIGAGRFAQLYI